MIPCDLCWILCFPLFVVFWLSLLIIFYYRQLRLQRVKKYEFDNKTVLVITAHPDDECMFFSPSILNLPRFCRTIHVLCLTTGMPKTEVYHLGFSCVYTIHLSPTPLPKLSRFFFPFHFSPSRDLRQSSSKPDFVYTCTVLICNINLFHAYL